MFGLFFSVNREMPGGICSPEDTCGTKMSETTACVGLVSLTRDTLYYIKCIYWAAWRFEFPLPFWNRGNDVPHVTCIHSTSTQKYTSCPYRYRSVGSGPQHLYVLLFVIPGRLLAAPLFSRPSGKPTNSVLWSLFFIFTLRFLKGK